MQTARRVLGLSFRWGEGGAPFLLGPVLPGDSLRTTRGGTQSGSWVQGLGAPLTYDHGQVSAHPSSYLLLTRSCGEGTMLVPSLQQREPRPREEKLLTSGHTGVTRKQVLKFKPSLPLGRSPSGSPPGLLLPAPPPHPCQYKTETGFMVPGATHLLAHYRNWPLATRAKACWRGCGSDRDGHTAGPRPSSSITQGSSLRPFDTQLSLCVSCWTEPLC